MFMPVLKPRIDSVLLCTVITEDFANNVFVTNSSCQANAMMV